MAGRLIFFMVVVVVLVIADEHVLFPALNQLSVFFSLPLKLFASGLELAGVLKLGEEVFKEE
jgi:hypothetical protein